MEAFFSRVGEWGYEHVSYAPDPLYLMGILAVLFLFFSSAVFLRNRNQPRAPMTGYQTARFYSTLIGIIVSLAVMIGTVVMTRQGLAQFDSHQIGQP